MDTVHINTVEITTASGATVVADIRYNDSTGNWYARYLDGNLRIGDKRQIVSGKSSHAEVTSALDEWATAH